MKTKLLTQYDEINQAKHLVYQDYFLNRKWFPENNLSGLHIEQIGNFKIFADDYDKVSSWFGVYSEGDMVGCCRLCNKLNGLFEVERYHSLPQCIERDGKVFELNRYATQLKFSNDIGIFATLMKYIAEYALQKKLHIFSTTGINDASRYVDIGFERCDVPSFKFSESDSNYVDIVYTSNKIERKKEIIKRCAMIIASQQKPEQ
jgi:hypothetical protein